VGVFPEEQKTVVEVLEAMDFVVFVVLDALEPTT
jgi:hypothetical protein